MSESVSNPRNISSFIYDCLKYIVAFIFIFLIVSVFAYFGIKYVGNKLYNTEIVEEEHKYNLNIDSSTLIQEDKNKYQYNYLFDEKVLILDGEIDWNENNKYFVIINKTDLIWNDIIVSINANIAEEYYGIQSKIAQLSPNQSIKIPAEKFPTSESWFNTVQYPLKWMIVSSQIYNDNVDVNKGIFIKIFDQNAWDKEFHVGQERKW